MKKLFCIIFLVLISVLPFAGCKAKAPLQEEELYALDTVISMSVYSDNENAINSAKAEIYRLQCLLSVTDENSDIYKINSTPDTFVKVSSECFELIKTAIGVSKNSGGNFDITVYPAVELWGFTASSYKVPTQSELVEVKAFIGYNNIELDENTESVRISKGTRLDLGGIAKGYIADKAAEALKEQGVESALLNFGGNIKLIGKKPTGDSFKIGIKAPFDDGYFAILKAENATASTAGGYERYFEENGKRYHHILNPFTASPAESDVISATVIGEKGEVCDALSTAAFVMGSSGVSELTSAYSGYSFVLLTEDTVYVSEGISDNFELTESYQHLEIKII